MKPIHHSICIFVNFNLSNIEHFFSNRSYHEKEEAIATLVHNFLLPEVEKEIIRDKFEKKQRNYLKAAHDTIYSKVQKLPKPPPKPKRNLNLQGDRKLMSRSKKMNHKEKENVRISIDSYLPETKSLADVDSDLNILFSAKSKTGFL